MDKEFLDKLSAVQMELKAPKGQYNSFGKYSYRSCEDILEAVKPLLSKNGLTLLLTDEPVAVGNRVYIKATARLIGGGDSIEVTAYAREPEDKKGMDTSQVTGTASSYARKYALNGLFLIDDTKDADTDEYKRTTGKDALTCSKCGKAIKDYKKADGTVTPAKVVFDSGGGMCLNCYQKNGG